jgi:PDDEXK-like uncharacterized protein DUF3799
MPHTTTHIAGALAGSRKILNLPADDYFGDIEVQSCSQLKPMLESPAHYQVRLIQPRATTKAMEFGRLVHTLVLEPHRLALDFAVFPGKRDGRDRDFKDFAELHQGKQILDEVQLHEARLLADRLVHRVIRLRAGDPGRAFGDFLAEGEKEVTIYYTDPTTGVRCRCRIDLLHPEILFDLKTAAAVIKAPWLRDALRMHYDMQAYMYSLAQTLFAGHSTPLPFIFVAGESAIPHSTSVFVAGSSFMREGSLKYARAIGAFAACSAVHHWPDQGEDGVLELDPWMANAATAPGWQDQLAVQASESETTRRWPVGA